MAEVDIHIASRSYPVACRDGEEARLRDVAALVDAKARAATGALGMMSEARTLLFASLMLADGLVDGPPVAPVLAPADPIPAEIDPVVAEALERLAARIEALADMLDTADIPDAHDVSDRPATADDFMLPPARTTLPPRGAMALEDDDANA